MLQSESFSTDPILSVQKQEVTAASRLIKTTEEEKEEVTVSCM